MHEGIKDLVEVPGREPMNSRGFSRAALLRKYLTWGWVAKLAPDHAPRMLLMATAWRLRVLVESPLASLF